MKLIKISAAVFVSAFWILLLLGNAKIQGYKSGYKYGTDYMQEEAIAHDKAEYITNEAGEQI